MRPAWMIRAGLFLYDHLARREILPASRAVDLRRHAAGVPLKPEFRRGFVYSDGWVDDARLVVLAAIDAAERGARIATRCRVVRVARVGARWSATLQHRDGREETVTARALVNAAGPWASQFLREHAHLPEARSLRLVKGSHIVVPRLFEHDHAYIFQNPDRRIIFAIPYERDYTLIGTTDVEHHGPIGEVRIDADEIGYLCAQASRYFAQPVQPQDVVWTYSGVRPLLGNEGEDDAAAVTRDYELELRDDGAPLLSVWGGKITTFRKLAEEAADRLCGVLGVPGVSGQQGAAWTVDAPLPGGDLREWIGAPQRPDVDLQRFEQALARRHPQLPEALRGRWARAYGLHEAELDYLHRHEWARSADDVLWRRSKLGLHMDEAAREQVARWCETRWQGAENGLEQAAR